MIGAIDLSPPLALTQAPPMPKPNGIIVGADPYGACRFTTCTFKGLHLHGLDNDGVDTEPTALTEAQLAWVNDLQLRSKKAVAFSAVKSYLTRKRNHRDNVAHALHMGYVLEGLRAKMMDEEAPKRTKKQLVDAAYADAKRFLDIVDSVVELPPLDEFVAAVAKDGSSVLSDTDSPFAYFEAVLQVALNLFVATQAAAFFEEDGNTSEAFRQRVLTAVGHAREYVAEVQARQADSPTDEAITDIVNQLKL